MHWLRTTFYLFRNLGFYVSEQKKQPPYERSRLAVTYMAKLYLGVHVRCAFCIIIGRSLTLIVFSSVFKISRNLSSSLWFVHVAAFYTFDLPLRVHAELYVRFSMGLLTGLVKFYCTFRRCLHGESLTISHIFLSSAAKIHFTVVMNGYESHHRV